MKSKMLPDTESDKSKSEKSESFTWEIETKLKKSANKSVT